MTEFLFKFVLAGDMGKYNRVGKTCFMRQYVSEEFRDDHENTVGVEFESKDLDVDSKTKVKIQVWDTSGDIQFRAITRNFFKNTTAAIFLYDITNRESFDSVEKWYNECRNLSSDVIQCAIVGTKLDYEQQRQVQTQEGQELSNKLKCNHYEIDCHNKESIEQIFNVLSFNVLRNIESGKIDPEKEIYGVKVEGNINDFKQQNIASQEQELTEHQNKNDEIVKQQTFSKWLLFLVILVIPIIASLVLRSIFNQ